MKEKVQCCEWTLKPVKRMCVTISMWSMVSVHAENGLLPTFKNFVCCMVDSVE